MNTQINMQLLVVIWFMKFKKKNWSKRETKETYLSPVFKEQSQKEKTLI